MMAADDRPAQRNTSLLRTVRTVAWAMFGVRNTQQHRNDEQALRPLQVVGVGLVGLILFVLLLIGLVNWLV